MRLGISQLGLSQWRPSGGSPPSLVLDSLTAGAAYSVRKLRTAYTGPALRVRESGGNTEADIGFDSNGDLDTAALLSHCGANSGFVVTWYDQSGNDRHVTQATTANQPRIVNAGVIETQNFLPSVRWTATSQWLSTTSAFLYASGAMTALFVASKSTASGSLASENRPGFTNPIYRLAKGATGDHAAVFFRSDTGATIIGNSTLLAGAIDADLQQVTYKDTGSEITAYQGLTAGTPVSYTRSALTTTLLSLGGDIRTVNQDSWNGGYISEAIFFASALNDTDREFIAGNQSAAFPP